MRSSRLSRLLPTVLAFLLPSLVQAQDLPIGTWTAYPSLQSVDAVAASGDAVWAATTGGVFSVDVESGEIRRFTRVDGLSEVGATSLAWDERRNALWVGYQNGSLDRIDDETGTIQSFYDISRADQFTSRGLNRMRIAGDSLLISTDFGLVVFDAARAEVRDSYTRLGSLEPATAVYDALFAPLPVQAGALAGTPGLWLATERGVVWAPRAANLREPAAWTLDANSPQEARALGFYQDQVWVGTTTAVLTRVAAGGWSGVYTSRVPFLDFLYVGDRFFVQSVFFLIEVGSPISTRYNVSGYFTLSSAVVGPDGDVWQGDRRKGLFTMPSFADAGPTSFEAPARLVVPNGPVNNLTRALSIGPDGSVWVAHGGDLNRSGISRLLPDGTWQRFDSEESDVPRVSFYDSYVDRDGTYYGGSIGRGLRPDLGAE